MIASPCGAQEQPPPPDGPPPTENSPAQCQNELDDDGDGLIDCDDDGCGQLIFCLGRDAQTEDDAQTCHNHRDDDGDGFIDCRDEGCAAQCRRSMTYGQLEGRSVYAPREAEEPPPRMEYVEHEAEGDYPQAWAAHPLTYRRGMLVPELAFSAQPIRTPRFGEELLARVGLGLSYALFDFWQVTVVPVPLRLSPVVDVENPAIDTTVRLFSAPEFELGLAINVGVPIGRSGSSGFPQPVPRGSLLSRARFYDVAHLDMGLLARVHIEELVRIDLEVPVATVIFASNAAGDLEPRVDLSFIARVGVSITQYVYAGVYSGAFIAGPNYDVGRIPFGFFAGVVIPGWRRGPAADLGVRFGWPVLYDSGASPEVDPGFWQLTFDARVFSWLLPP